MSVFSDRLARLRAVLHGQNIDGLILQTGDEHITEFTADYAKRLRWLTGFRGSTAFAALLPDKAAVFVPGLYTEAVREHVDGALWSYENMAEMSIDRWLAKEAKDGQRIGFDPWLHRASQIEAIEKGLAGTGIVLVPLDSNPIDPLWEDQPARPQATMRIHPDALAGRTSAEKRQAIADWLGSIKADACALVALDSIAWLLNVRGHDIDIMPLSYAYALVGSDAIVDIFVDEAKLDEGVRRHFGNGVRVHPYEEIREALKAFGGRIVSVDSSRSPYAIGATLKEGGAIVREDRDPTILAKAIKNPVEIQAMQAAHLRDGAALTRFLHWFSIEAPKGQLTEMNAASMVDGFRAETSGYHSLSFDTISAFGEHAALPHYWVTHETDIPIGEGIYLVDSGGQYEDGTTDITRTTVVGEPTAEMKDRFTRVLKGHIALGSMTFPSGTRGSQLDGFARQFLWQAGLDYDHGTGHGVGAFLCVHEGPNNFSPSVRGDEPIVSGMIMSNEPGYYKVGHYGIRIENLVVVVERMVSGAERPMLGFDNLSYAPIERRLIDVSLLAQAERDWLDDYHAEVLAKIGPLVPPDTRAWLKVQTAPIQA